MLEPDDHCDRRRLLQATAAGTVSAFVFPTIVDTTAGSTYASEHPPDEDEYADVLDAMDGSGSEEDPYVIRDVVGLQAIQGDREAHYELGNDVDATATDGWHDGSGFDPIGAEDEPFGGVFDGRGHEITGLTIDRPESGRVGLFGWSEGIVEDVAVSDASITGSTTVGIAFGANHGLVRELLCEGEVTGEERVGGFAGSNGGRVQEVATTGSVSGENSVGGLCGVNVMEVTDSVANSDVSGTAFVGGFCGRNNGVLSEVRATGDADGETKVGGVTGENDGEVHATTAEGSVSGEEVVGGFVGENWGDVRESSARATVSGAVEVGGFAGKNWRELTALAVRADVTGGELVGGAVGWNAPGGDVTGVYVVGEVDGETDVGALVGRLGWEFQSDGERSQLRESYWNADDIAFESVGIDQPGDGETVVEAVSPLGTGEMQSDRAATNMSAFDFETTWRVIDDDYPRLRALTPPVFEIVELSEHTIEVRQDESITLSVTIRNTSEWEGTQDVLLSIDREEMLSEAVTLDPGAETTLTFETATTTLPAGTFRFTISTDDDLESGSLVVESVAGTNGEDDDDGDTDEFVDDTPDDADDDGAGFGVPGAVAGLGGAWYLLKRRLFGNATGGSSGDN